MGNGFDVKTDAVRASADKIAAVQKNLNTYRYEAARTRIALLRLTLLPTYYSLVKESRNLAVRARSVQQYAKLLRQVAQEYDRADQKAAGYDAGTANPAFDEHGQYGGDQGSPENHYDDVADIVRRYHPDWSEQQIRQHLANLNNEGCGYVALINTVFLQYKNRPEAFESTFGFPMYNRNGDLNYDAMVTDLYTAQDDPNSSGTLWDSRKTIWEAYCRDHGINVTVNRVDVTAENFEELSRNGQIVVGVSPVIMYDESGHRIFANGGHAMTVTGVSDDGRLIVSSWGERYYLDGDLSVYSNHADFEQVVYQ